MPTNFIETVIETVTEIEAEKRGELSPLRLPEKLKSIRASFKLTQGKMLLIINPKETDENNRARVSQYERGLRVPSLIEVYNYARFAGITVETLLNDDLDLPAALQCSLDEEETKGSDFTEGEKVETNDEVETGETLKNSADPGEINNSREDGIVAVGESGTYREEPLD